VVSGQPSVSADISSSEEHDVSGNPINAKCYKIAGRKSDAGTLQKSPV
jgi:hypothetical protein